LGEYYLSHPDMRIPDNGSIYSVNEGLLDEFEPAVKRYLDFCKSKRFSARYIGSFVADFHRNLLKGGIFLYPATAKNPIGKLRMMYECNPMAFLAEQAGGRATTGSERIMELQPKSLHQRAPLFIGSKAMVDQMEAYLASEAPVRA
jgi:fructose-1,6-bisphosphatase I